MYLLEQKLININKVLCVQLDLHINCLPGIQQSQSLKHGFINTDHSKRRRHRESWAKWNRSD